MLPSFVVDLNTNNTCYSRLVTQFPNVILTYLRIFYLCYHQFFQLAYLLSESIWYLIQPIISANRNWSLALTVNSPCSNCILTAIRSLASCSYCYFFVASCQQLVLWYNVIYICILSFHLIIFVRLSQFHLALIVPPFHSNSTISITSFFSRRFKPFVGYPSFVSFNLITCLTKLIWYPIWLLYLLIPIGTLALLLLLFAPIACCQQFLS